MTSGSSQNNISSCEKCMQILKNILKFSPFPPRLTDGRSSSSRSPPHRHHPSIKPPKNMTPKLQTRRKMDGLDGGKRPSFIKIHGPDERGSESTQTSTLEASVTILWFQIISRTFMRGTNTKLFRWCCLHHHGCHHIFDKTACTHVSFPLLRYWTTFISCIPVHKEDLLVTIVIIRTLRQKNFHVCKRKLSKTQDFLVHIHDINALKQLHYL
ncbi:hypothetical protein CTI12_AA501660 [Artemisia annua]|uniref:Uncharacterized protein n=1 Tax=Artemisia annua TaxID=35608 RepID=A0A2U1LD34_ARTAN|nr:hypothetical protein CTI12_AA501660 [Artemisia annua]